MSYNISSWKIRTLHLTLPLDFDFQDWLDDQPDRDERGFVSYGKRWCVEDEAHIQVDLAAYTWELSLSGDNGLSGVIENDLLSVTKLDCRSDSSGYLYSDILLPLFKEFKGTLDAVVVWEGGDTIEHVTIQDGVVSTEEIK